MNDTNFVLQLERLYRMFVRWLMTVLLPWLWQRLVWGYDALAQRWQGLLPHQRWFVFAFGVALLTRMWRLDAQSLWLDEGATWAEIHDKSVNVLLTELWSRDAAYPLYHLILKGWVELFGDSEAMLRMPSVIASAFAVATTTLIFERQPQRGFTLLLMATAPFVLWHAQDAKVYALLMAVAAVILVARPLSPMWWVALVVLPFVHRLGLLMVALAFIVPALQTQGRPRQVFWGGSLTAGVIAVMGIGLSIRAKTITAVPWHNPVASFADIVTRFLFDRRWFEKALWIPAWVWILPLLGLLIIGSVMLWQQATAGRLAAVQVLLFAYVPVLIIGVSYGATPYFDARYAVMALPAWICIMVQGADWALHNIRIRGKVYREIRLGRTVLILAVLINGISLFEPVRGMFSGAPVKEEWRVVMRELANRVTRDDVVVLHPAYAMPMYRYYRRVTPDPLPMPAVFTLFTEGYRGSSRDITAQREYQRRMFEGQFNQAAQGKSRALLVIAPDHAAQIDPPIRPDSPYGWVGAYFQYPQRTWPCGGVDRYGVSLMCQSFPSIFGKADAPQPEKMLDALFGDSIHLRGVTIRPIGTFYKPNGIVPVTLFWEALTKPARDYSMFIHLCQLCNQPPLAQTDGPPLGGYGDAGRSTTWQIKDPVHDERAIVLPADIEPGNYYIIVGVYDPDGVRLPITSSAQGGPIKGNRLLVDHIRVIR
jgi:mannosyltransferase